HVIEHVGAPVGYVKQAGVAARLDGDDTVAVEAALLGAIAPLQLAPTPILQGGSGSVWMTALPGEELSIVRDPAVLRPAAVDLGRALARLHRHPVPEVGMGVGARVAVPNAPRPWPLLDRLPTSMEGGEQRADTRPILDTLAEPTVQRALDAAREQWRPTHLIHGDVSPGNVIVRISPSGDVRVGLVDFELGGKGCPAMDLASATAMLGELSPVGDDLARLCLDAYWTACGPASVTAPWRCVRALLTAWQVALTHGEVGAADVARLLARAVAAASEITP
ncbi:MAG: aminoglycoside phosphotransferase family protein, partial [Knoellia sp.]